MKRIPFLLELLVLSSFFSVLNAQTSEIDSLTLLLQQPSKKDSTWINLLNATALSLYEYDNELMLSYANEALELSKKIRFVKGRAEALRILGTYHYSKSENSEAQDYFLKSLALFEEIGYSRGVSKCLNNIGRVHWKLGEYDRAMEQFEKSLRLAEELGDNSLISKSLGSFGILSAQKGNYQEALEYIQESNLYATLAGDKKSLSSNLHNIGYIHMRQGNYSESIRYFEQTLDLLKEIGDKQGESGVLLNIGIIHQNQGNYNEAIGCYQRSSEIDEEYGDKQGVSRCLNNIGLIYQDQGNYPLALEYIQNSLKIKEEISDQRGVSSCLMNIGSIHAAQEDHENALDYFNRSLQILEELQDKSGISNCLMGMGITSGKQGNFQEAFEYLQKSLVLTKEIGERYGESQCLSSIGNLHAQMGDHQEALVYYKESLEIKTELSDRKGICDLFGYMGNIYLATEDFTKALDYTQKSLGLGRELDLLEEQVDMYKQLTDIYLATHNYRASLENHMLHKELYDSLYNEENIRRIAGLEYQYRYEKEKQATELVQQKKDALQAQEAKQQKTLRNSFIVGFVLMLVLVVVILVSFFDKRKANHILEEQNRKIESQNNAITDSINYARRIQHALFPPKKNVDTLLKDYFIFHKPRDIVSGDFYWLAEKEGKLFAALADCTGHGVPGAFMSLLGIAFLNEIVKTREVLCANDILNQLRTRVIQSLHQTGRTDEQRDGMELALCIFDPDFEQMQYSGAFRPLYLVRKQEIMEVKADKMPLGIYDDHQPFTCHNLHLQKNDTLYLFSDGYVDQTGGPKRKSYKSKYFKELLLSIQDKGMADQKLILETTLEEWRGGNEQIDDILVMGIRV